MMAFDLIVIGAGPAGLSAATLTANKGAAVALLDEQSHPGGQIYRHVTQSGETRDSFLGDDYTAGRALVEGLGAADVRYIPSATVWSVSNSGHVVFNVQGQAREIEGQFVLLATGALERPVPLPGWTLPGVMTAGAAQILLKTAGMANDRAILVGAGPLLYLLAAQMIKAGVPPLAIVETQTWRDYARAQRYFPGALRGYRTVLKGLGLLADLRKAGIRRYTGASKIEILGRDRAAGIRFVAGRSIELESDAVFLHQGVVPNTQLTRALGLAHEWSDTQRCFRPTTDEWGRSSNDKLFVAGDGAGIDGAIAAEHAGSLCAAEVLHQLGRLTQSARDTMTQPARKGLRRERAVRPFLDTLYSVPDTILRPPDSVTVCRCEEVTAGDIRQLARLGCRGPNQTKAFGRCGMGPCQGRYCGSTVTELLAFAHDESPENIGAYRIRMPIKPVTLGEVASLADLPDSHGELTKEEGRLTCQTR